MNWVTDNKGAGPWDFQEQGRKLGYINNPRWAGTPASLIEHEPCGYWDKNILASIPESGPLWGCGTNEYGQLGFPTNQGGYYYPDFAVPGPSTPCYWTHRLVPNMSTAWRAASNGPHSMIILADGSLWGAGLNNYGQLGLGPGAATSYSAFQRIGTDTDWVSVACGNMHTAALKQDGTLWTTGLSGTYISSALGLGDLANRNVFTQVPGGAVWKAVSCGGGHTLAIKTDGTLWATGLDSNGELGLGSLIDDVVSFTQVGGNNNWASVQGSNARSYAITTTGALYGWGYNAEGELGLGDTTMRLDPTLTGLGGHRWRSVYGGSYHTVGVRHDGSLWVTGGNTYGQLGLGDTTKRHTFTQVSDAPALRSVVCTGFSTLLIATDYSLWGVGHNAYGELGNGPHDLPWVDQHTWEQHTFTRVGTENNWLMLPEQGSGGLTSLVIRTPQEGAVPQQPVSVNPVWTLPA